MQRVKYFFYIYFGVLILALTAIGAMGWLGYKMIEEGMVYVLFGLLVVSALVALAVFIFRRMQAKWSRIIAATLSGVLILGITLAMVMFFTMMGEFGVPKYYNSFTSPTGKTAVVLRSYSADPELQALRPEGSEGFYNGLGIRYTAYPKAALFFYNAREGGEGKVEIGTASSAGLMYEWIDGDTLRLYIDDPQPGDAGEHVLKFK